MENRVAQTYTFDKETVLKTLIENRSQHDSIFREALEGYKKTTIQHFKDNIRKIEKGKLISFINLQVPKNQIKDYDRVISLLEQSKGEEVELTEVQFANYMLDDWDWKQSFYAANSAYSFTAASKLNEEDDD